MFSYVFFSESSASKKLKFSDSGAFYGYDRGATTETKRIVKSTFNPDYYSTEKFRNQRLVAWLGSFAIFLIYFLILR